EEIGDFGELVYAGMDWVEPALNKRSMQLMAEEVMPRVNPPSGNPAVAACPHPAEPVMRGLDPRIHRLSKRVFRRWMDCRVKPGNDGLSCRVPPLAGRTTMLTASARPRAAGTQSTCAPACCDGRLRRR